jgi:glycosyltransferase involved in cell wall biosynthesis
MHEPLVTVLMPAYNAARYVHQAVASILRQSCADFELLIIDDGSRDETHEVLESYGDGRIRLLVNNTNRGIAAALNQGLAQARGKYIARQDADDVSHPTRLSEQAAFLEANPAVALLGTQARLLKPGFATHRSPVSRALSHEAIKFQALFSNPFLHTSVMYRREVVWTQLQGYNSDYRICQDYDLWLRVLRHHRVANLDRYLVDFRSHAQSISRSPEIRDVQARRELLRANLSLLIPDCNGLEDWPQLWATAIFRRSPLTRKERQETVRLATLCLQRCLRGADPSLRWQMRHAYAGYLLSILAHQQERHAPFAWTCAARALCASPMTCATALTRIAVSSLAGDAWWSRQERPREASDADAGTLACAGRAHEASVVGQRSAEMIDDGTAAARREQRLGNDSG